MKPITLLLSVLLLAGCNKKTASPSAEAVPSDVKTGTYVGEVLMTPIYQPYVIVGSTHETATLSHESGNTYTLTPANDSIPSFSMEFKEATDGYGILMSDQKCKYGKMVAEPMTKFGMAYNGIYTTSTSSINIGGFATYVPGMGIGGIDIVDDSGKTVAFLQFVLTKK